MIYFVARIVFYVLGWRKKGKIPDEPKFVLIFGPHTSYTDNYMVPAVQAVYGFEGEWLAAEKLFRNPLLRAFLLWGGARPVDRNQNNGLVEKTIKEFKERDQFILGIAPKGTRKKRDYWKSGFYWMAYGADVPIVCLGMDYKRKELSMSEPIYPCGDIYEDMKIIRRFYEGKVGRHPERMSPFEVEPGLDVPEYCERLAS